MATFGSTNSAATIMSSDEVSTYVAANAQPLNASLTALAAAGFGGDYDGVISGTSTVAANKVRTIGGRLQIESGGVLVIEDTGALAIV